MLLFLSTPIAFAEATTTQNDNFAAMWMIFFVYLMLNFLDCKKRLNNDKPTRSLVIDASLCISFGYLAKPNTCFGMLILLIWLLIICIRRKDKIITIIQLCLIAIPGVIIPIIPQWIQNLKTVGSLSPGNVGARELIGTLQPNYVFINFLKNFSNNVDRSITIELNNLKEKTMG